MIQLEDYVGFSPLPMVVRQHGIKPSEYLDYREFLAAIYQNQKAKHPSYSYLRFSEDLGMGLCVTSHLVISGKRPLTVKAAEKITLALDLEETEKTYFVTLVGYTREKSPTKKAKLLERLARYKSKAVPVRLSDTERGLVATWYLGAIVELLGMEGAQDKPSWLAGKLRSMVTEEQVAQALIDLEALGYLGYDPSRGRLVPRQVETAMAGEVVGAEVQKYHRDMLHIASQALGNVAPELRSFQATTVAIPESMIAEIKLEYEAMKQTFIKRAKEASGKDRIVQVNFQIFPLTEGVQS